MVNKPTGVLIGSFIMKSDKELMEQLSVVVMISNKAVSTY